MANCKSMLEAFLLGGDFHSRTALGMYPHVRKVCAAGPFARGRHVPDWSWRLCRRCRMARAC
jgi:hypothetical protein